MEDSVPKVDDSAPPRQPPRAQAHRWRAPYSALTQLARRLVKPLSKTDVRETLDKARPLLEDILEASDPEALPVLDALYRLLPMHVAADQDLVRQVYGLNHKDAQVRMLEGMLKRADTLSYGLSNPTSQNPGEPYEPALSLRNALIDWKGQRELPPRLAKKMAKTVSGLGMALLRYELRGVYGQPPECTWKFTVKRALDAQDDIAEMLLPMATQEAQKAYFLVNPEHPSYPQWIVEAKGNRDLGKRVSMVALSLVGGSFPMSMGTPYANILTPDLIASPRMIQVKQYRDAYFRDLVRLFREEPVRKLTGLRDLVLCWEYQEPDEVLLRELNIAVVSRARENGATRAYYVFQCEKPYTRSVGLNFMALPQK